MFFFFFLERETNLAFPKWDRISLFPFNRVLIFIFYFPNLYFDLETLNNFTFHHLELILLRIFFESSSCKREHQSSRVA